MYGSHLGSTFSVRPRPPMTRTRLPSGSGPQWRHYVSLGTDQMFRARADIPLIGSPQHRIEENVLEYPCADESSEGPSRQAEFGTEDKKESPQEEPARDLEDQVLEKRSAGPDVREYLHCSVEETGELCSWPFQVML